MACPFSGATASKSSGGGGGCPFARQAAQHEGGAAAAGAGAGGAHAAAARLASATLAAAPSPAPQASPAAAPDGKPAVCPFGFGSGAGGKGRALSELDCMLCKALLHDAVSAQPCTHKFCAACIAAARDCPCCGCDIDGVAPAPDAQALVDAYLSSHGRSSGLVEAQQAAMAEATGGGPPDATPASFFLFHGVRSMMGGNLDAALSRLGRCRALLEEDLAAAEAAEAAEAVAATAGPGPARLAAGAVACRLGAVCGSLGDCWRRRGDLAAAEGGLEAAAAHLQRFSARDGEAADALAVTLAKLGDLQFYRAQAAAAALGAAAADGSGGGGDTAAGPSGAAAPERVAAAAALPFYERTLEQRRALCGPLGGGRGGAGAGLNLVTALAKVADAHETLGAAAAAQRTWRQAASELRDLKGAAAAGAADAPAAAKMRALEELLAARGHLEGAPAPAPAS